MSIIANPRRGEVEIIIDNKPMLLCLTLGGLAQLENLFSIDSITELSGKFKNPSAKDLIKILLVLLNGGGTKICEDELLNANINPQEVSQKIAQCFQLAFEK